MQIVEISTQKSGKRVLPYTLIDKVGLEERANSFTKRSIKKESKLEALYLAIEMTDLTTLEGMDTLGKVGQLCSKGMAPFPSSLAREFKLEREIPSVAAVCVYPSMVKHAVACLKGTGINVASVATAFPSGQLDIKLKLKQVEKCVKEGASEIDMVINRGAFHQGQYQKVHDEIRLIKEASGPAHLKVILETGELGTYDNVRLASWIAMEAGGDFIKTSTGKISPAATMPVTLVMFQAIQDFYDQTGKTIGMKPAGGIRTAKQAIHYLCMLNEVLGPGWLSPELFRFGASSLLNDLIRQILKQQTSHYFYDDLLSQD